VFVSGLPQSCTYGHDALDGVDEGRVKLSLSREALGAQRGKALILHVVDESADNGGIIIILRRDEGCQEGNSGKEGAELHFEDVKC
jgi:hypothetical protein